MEIQIYIEQKKKLYDIMFAFIDCDDNEYKEKYENMELYFKNEDIGKSKIELLEVLHLISNISSNHNRRNNFIAKIENILLLLKHIIQQTLTNLEVYEIFKYNKRILLFLFTKIIKIDEFVKDEILYQSDDYKNYFAHNFDDISLFHLSDDDITYFDKKCLKGENSSYICELIRNDNISEFVPYTSRANTSLSSLVDISIFETNVFLIDNRPTLIEYAAFFGSVQIFKYIQMNDVEIKASIWLYAIHSDNPEMIYHLESLHLDINYEVILSELIKCHHNNIATYIIENFMENDDKQMQAFLFGIKFYNYFFFTDEIYLMNSNFFYVVTNYNTNEFTKMLLSNTQFLINEENLLNICEKRRKLFK